MNSALLVRHGETAWTLTGQHTSHTDLPLTEHGREEATALAGAVAGRSFALVLSSPMRRAIETAEVIGIEDRVGISDDLREWDYGDYEALTTADVRKQRPAWNLWTDDAPNGETAEQVGERADRVVAAVRAAAGDVLLVTHGHVARVLAARWVGLGPRDGGRLGPLAPAATAVLGWEREVPTVSTWNA